MTYLEAMPAGNYEGDIYMETDKSSRMVAFVSASVDSDQNLVGTVQYYAPDNPNVPTVKGTISGKIVFDGSNFNNNWRHYEEHFHLPYPTMMIDVGDGSGPQPHKVIFDRPFASINTPTPPSRVCCFPRRPRQVQGLQPRRRDG